MLMVRTSVRYSPIHGLGCFAEEDIKKGQEVWRLDPTLDITIDADKISDFPAAVQDFLMMYCYSEMRAHKKVYILCGDSARHMNHSESPNLLEGRNGEESTNIAGRDIKQGEELTCNYIDFDGDAKNKLSP